MEFNETEALRNEIRLLRRELARQSEESVKKGRELSDTLANLDADNMPAVAKLIREAENGIAGLTVAVGDQEESISGIARYVDPESGFTAQASESLVASINGSSYSLDADRINFNGYTVFARTEDLENGLTVINGSCITTGELNTELLKVDGNGYALIPKLCTKSIYSGDDNSLAVISYGDINLTSLSGNINLVGSAFYSGSEIAVKDDLPPDFTDDIRQMQSALNDLIDRCAALEARVSALEGV